MENMIVNLSDVDVTENSDFKSYEDFKEQLNFEQENRPFPHTYIPQEIRERNQAVSVHLATMDNANLKAKADALLKAQNIPARYDDLIDHMASKSNGNYAHFSSQWSPLLWQSRETTETTKVNVGNQVMESFDLDFMIAESLQKLYSGEDPKAEYYDWIERQQQIEIDIRTDGTTEDEIVARNTFITFLDDRETDIKRIIQLYSGAAFNSNSKLQTEAKEKLKFLTFKLSELRRLRERTQNTKDHADSKEYFEAKERAERREAIAATAAISAIALTPETMSLGERRLQEAQDTDSLEHGIGESFVRLRPETHTPEQAREKIAAAKLHREEMIAMFTAMRNGISKEEWLKMRQEGKAPQVPMSTREKIRRLQGFRAAMFKQYSNQMSA